MRKFFCAIFSISLIFLLCGFGQNFALKLTIVTGWGNFDYFVDKNDCFYGVASNSYVENLAEKIAKERKINPVESKAIFNLKNKTVSFSKEVCGYEIDKESLVEKINVALSLGGGEIFADYRVVKPKYTKQELSEKISLRSEFFTNFSNNFDRINNIILATKSINSSVVLPNQVFSFNKVVGERSEKRGYKNAKIILNGQFVDGVGGGVCQVSTTLYNAVLLAGLKIEEAHRHSVAVNYVEQSFDAMVSGDLIDLKFKNVTKFPIYIFGGVDKNRVAFYVFGEKSDVKYKKQSVITGKIEGKVQYVVNESLAEGEKRIISPPKNGFYSQGYLLAFKNGQLISKEKIRSDVYNAVDGITEVKKIEDI